MKKLVISIIFIITMIPAFAQIEDEIQQTKKVKIENGRAYLLEKFLERDYEKVKEITDYLLDLEDDNYCALSMSELWLLPYWTQDFDLLTTMLGFDSTDCEVYKTKILPAYDQLYAQLYRHSIEDEHLLHSNLQEAELSAEDREFLTIYLDWVLDNKCYNDPRYNYDFYYYGDISQKEYNERLDKFLAKYPDSRYKWVANNIIHKSYYDKSNWGFGVSFELCSGFSTGQMHKPVGGFGLSFNVSYKKLELDLGGDIIAANTRYNITYSGDSIYSKGSEIDFALLYANLSYNIVDNKSIRLSPVVGVGYNWESYSVSKKKRENNRYVLYQVGLNFDIKLKDTLFDDQYIRIRYNCGITNMGQSEISTLHFISVGWTGFSNRKFVK